jgi:serine/threonine protein kinase
MTLKLSKKLVSFHFVEQNLGEGAFSQVYRVIRIGDNLEYALKQVRTYIEAYLKLIN